MDMKSLFATGLVFLSLCSCDGCGKIKEEMERFYGQHVTLPLDSMLYMADDSARPARCVTDGYKLVVYYDSAECSSCRMKTLYEWNDLMESASSSGCVLDFYFVFNVPQRRTEDVRASLAKYARGLPVYLDTTGVFERKNPNLPCLSQMRTFMLDRKDTVVLVGNPVRNSRVEAMMWNVVEGKESVSTYDTHDNDDKH